MGFYEQFELLELVRDVGVKTFDAREVATGRPVTAHLFSNPTAPLQAELLKKVNELPPAEAARIIARGTHLGAVYLITDNLADYGGLLEWLTASKKALKPMLVPEPEPPRASAPPISAVIEPAGQLKLNKEFAELFATGQRPVFDSHRNTPTPAPKPPTADPNEITQPIRAMPQMAPQQPASPNQPETSNKPVPAQTAPPHAVPPPLPTNNKRSITPLVIGIVGIAILLALFLLFFTRRGH